MTPVAAEARDKVKVSIFEPPVTVKRAPICASLGARRCQAASLRGETDVDLLRASFVADLCRRGGRPPA